MLERAAACLKSGAARDSLRRTSKAPRSKRMLHSTFWNHGAGALDLPPYMVLPIPTNLPLSHDSSGSLGTKRRERTQRPVASEGVFLDFLYPPQALAWLQRASAQQQLQKWEKRNIRRLPEGFVVASRGYASKSYRRQGSVGEEVGENVYQPFGPQASETTEDQGPKEERESWLEGSEWSQDSANRNTESTGDEHADPFAISPGELAESTPNLLISLRNLLTFNRGTSATGNLDKTRRLVDRAWTMFESLDEHSQNDVRLRRELLDWLSLYQDGSAAAHCEELFRSISTGERTAEIYNSMLSAYLRLNRLSSASDLHHESLQTLENGYVISKRLFEYAIERNNWQLAIQTAAQHRNRYTELGLNNQVQLFWLHVSDMPQLPEKAMLLFNYLEGKVGLRTADLDTRRFCSRIFKEAISQVSVAPEKDGDTESRWWKLLRQPETQDSFIEMLQFVGDQDGVPAKDLERALFAFLHRNTAEYANCHRIASYIYWKLRKLFNIQPSERLLSLFLWRLIYYEPKRSVNKASAQNVTIHDIMSDWRWFHGKPSKVAYTRLVASSARAGRLEEHQHWMDDFRSAYPKFEDWNGSLWTMIYIYAQRTNLDGAQQAFAEVNRMTAEHGDEPDLKCWSSLLQAHGRADDLEGGFTNFQNLIKSANLKPTEECFDPMIVMLARRGDVDGLEDILEQYDEIVGERRSTRTLMHLMNAHTHQGRVREAESIFRNSMPKIRAGKIHGPMTPCFNSLMRFHARHNDIDATMDTYQWMKEEGARPDAVSFAAIIMVLCNLQRTDDAIKVLRVDMRKYGVHATASHYAIIMKRYFTNRQNTATISIYNEMIEQNIRTSVPSNTLYLQAKTQLENQKKRGDTSGDGDSMPLEMSIMELENMLERYDGDEVAERQFDWLVGSHDNTTADPGTYFETLIAVHGKRRCFDAVKSLFIRYTEAAKGRGGDEGKLPLGIISKLMSAHWHAGEYSQVEEYWKLAKERADEIAPPVPAPSFRYLVSEKSLQSADVFALHPTSESYSEMESTSSPGNDTLPLNGQQSDPEPDLKSDHESETPPSDGPLQTLLTEKGAQMTLRPSPRRRHILNQPLRWYLAALHSQSRVMDSIATVSRLLTQGYTMDKVTWNSFICYLLETTPPLALVAFVLTDRFLTPNFPGWVHQSRTRYPAKHEAHRAGLQYMNARYVEPSRLMPQYMTLVRLGAALLDIRRLESQGRRGIDTDVPPELRKFIGTTREIRKLAARTLHVVQSLPYIIGDPSQAKYLRREMD